MNDYKTALIVKHHNDLNTLPIGRLTSVELDLFLTILSTIKEKGTDEIVLTFDKIRQITNYTSTDIKDFVKALDNTNRKLIEMNFKIETEDIITRFVFFQYFEINKEKQTLTVAVNSRFSFLINEIGKHFSCYELQEFISVKSKYSKVLYKQLKQWKTTGFYTVDIDTFRHIFNIPKSYQITNIDKKVLEPALKELKPIFKNLSVKKVKDPKQKNKVVRLEFYFQKELGATAPGTVPTNEKKEVAPADDLILKNINNVPKI